MVNNKRYYYKTKDGDGFLNLKSKLDPIPEDYEEIDEETYNQLSQARAPKFTDVRKVEINKLKAKLKASDYKTNKRIEGYYTDDEWAEICAERRAWRNRINELEEELKNA